jgi:RNA polymerase sigma-70 factor (ECF subfamily)
VTPSAETSTEALLAHAGWMRALALGLVRDSHAADDVVQDAALVALLHPPPTGAALRPWLGQVVRRLAWRSARSERRRTEREAWAGEPGAPRDPAETLARLDLQRALLEAVRALEEPLRTTLVQRYFEGRSAAEIAAASGVPASTVRARLARALELLRARLDRETGSRAAWLALVAPLVPRELAPVVPGAVTASTLVSGALTMTLAKSVLVASTAVVAGLAWWSLADRSTPSEPFARAPIEAPIEPAAPPAAEAVLDDEPTAESSRAVAEAPAPEPKPAMPEQPAEDEMRGGFDARVVNEQGAPWAGAELTVFRVSEQDESPLASGTSGPDGRAQVELELPKWARRNRDTAGGAAATFELVVRRAGCAARHLEVVVREDDVTHLGEIVLVESGTVRGRVVDEYGAAVADARVGALAVAAFEALDERARDRLVRVGASELDELLARAVRPDGTFELDDVAPGSVRLWAHAQARRYALGEAIEIVAAGVVDDVVITLPALQAGERVAGRVVGPDGKGRPASLTRNAQSSRGGWVDFVQTGMDGRFEFPADHLDCVYELTASDGYGELTKARASGVRPGDLEVVIAFARGRSVAVRLRDESGAPVDAAVLWITGQVDGMTEAKSRVVEPGGYEVEWPVGHNALTVQATGYRLLRGDRFDQASVPDVIELTLHRAPLVRGVVNTEGQPLADAKVEAFPFEASGTMTVNGLRCTVVPFDMGSCTTDSAGQFELYVDADGPIVVRASAAGWVDVESEPLDAASRGADEVLELALGRGGAIEGRVLVPAGESSAGRIVGAHRGDGRPISTRTAEDGTFRFEGLMPGDWYVLPLEAEVPPHGGTYASTSTTEPMPWSCRVEEGRTTHFELELDGD